MYSFAVQVHYKCHLVLFHNQWSRHDGFDNLHCINYQLDSKRTQQQLCTIIHVCHVFTGRRFDGFGAPQRLQQYSGKREAGEISLRVHQPCLQRIDVSHNRIVSLHECANFTQLSWINARSNSLSSALG